MQQTWSPDDYARHAAFVPALGQSILARLAAQPGERILDLGCGDGTLTRRLMEQGATVVGVDASAQMVEAARAAGVDARVMDAAALIFDSEFDAVFSNAALHWVTDAAGAIDGIARALRPGGRFVAEFGGHGNVAAIWTAFRAVLDRHGLAIPSLWFYPSTDEYRALLEARGLAVEDITLFARPTPLPTGMIGWLTTFRGAMFAPLPPDLQGQVMDEIVTLLRPALCDSRGRWTADYVRLQVIARRP